MGHERLCAREVAPMNVGFVYIATALSSGKGGGCRPALVNANHEEFSNTVTLVAIPAHLGFMYTTIDTSVLRTVA